MLRLCQFLSVALCGWPLLFGLPEWSIASWVGGCWGALLLTGLSATWTKNRIVWSVYCLVASGFAHASLGVTTNFGHHANWLIITSILASGWFMGITLLPRHGSIRIPGPKAHELQFEPVRFQFSAWDILCITALVALFCSTIPLVENQFDLLCQTGPSLIGGMILSTFALQWAWRDTWTLSSLVSVIICLPLLTMLLVPWLNMETDFIVLVAWVISGPLSVIAAQFIVVLLWGAALRQRDQLPVGRPS